MTQINPAISTASQPASTNYGAFNSWFNPQAGNGVNVGNTGSFLDRISNPSAAPSGLDALLAKPTGLDALLAKPSGLDVLARSGSGETQAKNVDIRVQAPIQNVFGNADNSRYIEISVRPLKPSELGSLNASPGQIRQRLDAASVKMNTENVASYGKTTAELRSDAIDSGYFNSPAHKAWAQAAEARTGGRVSASWWRENDPFGGTAGNGPNILAQGSYPGALSKIAMGHDTDWTLGRQFGAGPLNALQSMGGSAEDRGKFGLEPFDSRLPNTYGTGHPDWNVDYTNPW